MQRFIVEVVVKRSKLQGQVPSTLKDDFPGTWMYVLNASFIFEIWRYYQDSPITEVQKKSLEREYIIDITIESYGVARTSEEKSIPYEAAI